MRKKFLQGATSLGIAAAICLACGVVTASAATLDKSKVTVNYATQKIEVDLSTAVTTEDPDPEDPSEPSTPPASSASEKEIMFGVSALKGGKVTTSSWEVYDVKGGKVEIDISSLNTQKDNYVQIKGDASSDPLTLLIPKTDKTFKLKFDPIKGQVTCTKGEVKTAALQFRTQYSDWMDYGKADDATAVNLSVYQQRGATLYFRLAGTDELTVGDVTEKDGIYTMASLPGKEIKVSVSKKANGPKATADFVKQTVKIPAGSQYRVIDPEEDTLPEKWTDNSSVTTLTGDKIPSALYNGGSLEVKKAATDKKAESKIFQLAFPNAKADINDMLTPAEEESGINGAKITEDDGKTVTFKMAKKGSGKKEKDVVEITNNTTSQYQVSLAADGSKAKTVKANKSITIDAKANDTIYVRRSGDKKNAIWATDFIPVGKVVIAEGGSDNPGDEAKEPTEQEKLNQLATELFNTKVTLDEGASKGDVITIANSTVTWGAAAEYTLKSGKKIDGVTITISAATGDGNVEVDTDTGEVTYKVKGGSISAGETDSVTVTLKKADCTDATATITFSL